MRPRPRTVHGIDLTAPDGIARLLAHHRARWGTATMTAPVTETTTETKPDVEQTTTETTTTETKDDGPKFSQADLDRIIGERVAAEKAKHDKALADAQALAGKNETEKLTIERDQAKQRAQEATQKAAERVAKTEAKVAAIAAGANPDRLAVIVKNTDLTEAVDADGNVDEAKVKTLVEKTLTDYPEWKKTTGTGPSASGGELNGGGGGKPTFTRKQLEEMPPEEMAKRIDEINAAVADGRVTG